MKGQKKIRDYGIIIGDMSPGAKNSITDVEGIRVGHITLDEDDIKTGVTAVLPHEGNTFREKVIGTSYVINGFGKTMGSIQIEELGNIETPIILTNTLSIGVASDALIDYMLEKNEDIGITTGTVNPVVCECNDAYLNDIRGSHVKKEHIFRAIENADIEFKEGSVGAGKGMSCYGLKGGIGTASRIVKVKEQEYIVGVLILTNFGKREDLIIDGIKAGKIISELEGKEENERDKGSTIVIVATNIPMTERQLKRISKRVGVGLNRTGSYIGNGSGEVVISFTTANKIKHYEKEVIIDIKIFNENEIDLVFRAVGEATEEAVLNSLVTAKTTVGRLGHKRTSLTEFINKI